MRLLISVLALMALAACQSTVSDTAVDTELAVDATAAETDAAATGEEITVVIDNNNPTISNTQDFAAQKEKESIESDKARLKAQREKFVAIAPTALPTRGKSVNVAEYALKTTNKVGEKLYKRYNPLGGVVASQTCKKYRLPDEAQEAFLSSGGPSRDPGNLDPDGDGFACDWSPETYRKLLK